MRTFGVEEELLLIDAVTLSPLPAAERVAASHQQVTQTGHKITLEFKQEQIEVVSPPQATFADQAAAIRIGRNLADVAASRAGGRVVALPTAPSPIIPRLVQSPRFRRIDQQFGLTSSEQLTCAFHVHVFIESREEGVAVLDRIRVWLPTLLALSANSPFWQGFDTGFASYRYQAWNRWPLTGPTDLFGSATSYDQHQAALLGTRIPLDPGMFYFDARLCEHQPTLEVRVADVCLRVEQAAAIATIVRALVEATARDWQAGLPAPPAPTSKLRAWSWQASRDGVEKELILPSTGTPAPARDVVGGLVESIRPILVEYGEYEAVESVVAGTLSGSSGAQRQREVYTANHDLLEVISFSLAETHHQGDTGKLPRK